MDLFGIKKRRAQREAKRAEAEKLAALKRKRIKEEFAILKERAGKIAKKSNDWEEEYASRVNDKCPKCGSTKVNDRIKRLQGEFKGEGSVEGLSIFGTGYVYGSSRSSGSIDTNPVNKCECGNEWKKRKPERKYDFQSLKDEFERLQWLLEDYHQAKTAKVDRNDLDEKFDTDEEKRKSLFDECETGTRRKYVQEFFKDIHIETIKEVAEKEVWEHSWSGTSLQLFYEHWDDKLLEEKLGVKPLPNLIGYVNV